MYLPPLIERELRLALRRRGLVRSRLRAAGVGVGICVVFMIISMVSGGNGWGRSMHRFLFLAGLFYAVIRPAQASAGLFSEERRGRTLELLFLTGMTPAELFAGKLLGCLVAAATELLALMPLLALPFLSGGVSVERFWATLVCLPLLLFLVVAITALASVICSDEGAAFVFAIAIACFLALATPLPYALGNVLTGSAPYSAAWLRASPAYAALQIGGRGGQVSEFWPSAAMTVCWAILCLAVAGIILRRNWRDQPSPGLRSWHDRWLALARGSPAWRASLRRRVLERNAFQWLAQRDRGPVLLAWGCLAGLCLVWVGGWCAWPHAWPSTVNFFLTAMLLLLLLDFLQCSSAVRRIGEDRRSGALELLLTTPLSPHEILDGQLDAVHSQFRPLRYALLGVCAAMAIGGFFIQSWNVQGTISYLLIWCFFFAWCSHKDRATATVNMWVALNTGQTAAAVFRSQGRNNWSWIWILFNLQRVVTSWGRGRIRFPSGSTMELVIVVFVILFILAIGAAKLKERGAVRYLFLSDLRGIAQRPVPERDDPRLKKWKNPHERMPAFALR